MPDPDPAAVEAMTKIWQRDSIRVTPHQFRINGARIITDCYAEQINRMAKDYAAEGIKNVELQAQLAGEREWKDVVHKIAAHLTIKPEHLAPRAESYLGEIRGHLNTLLLKEEVFDNVAELEERLTAEREVREKLMLDVKMVADSLGTPMNYSLSYEVQQKLRAALAEAEKL